MEIEYELVDEGIAVTLDGRSARITWPEEIWRAFRDKRGFATELVFLLTYGVAARDPVIRYGFPRPRFIDSYDRWFAATIPYLAEVPGALVDAVPERHFVSEIGGTQAPRSVESDASRAVAALTLGKDSLASLIVAQELELDVVAVHCQHPSLSDDFRIRVPAMRALGDELGIAVHSMIDDVKALSAIAAAPGHPSGILWSMSIAAYALELLPFAAFHRARYLLVGNEYDLNYLTRARSGELVSHSPLQTVAGMIELDRWIGELTAGAVRLTSPIHALHRMAGHKLIHQVRPQIGVHQMSCRSATANRRWCGACKTCAENSLFIRAMGRDPDHLGLAPMFDEAHADQFLIVSYGLDPGDPYRFHLAEQELLAFGAIASAGESSWVQRFVRDRYGARLDTDRPRLERTYLAPVAPPTGLPLAAEAFACARRLFATRE